MSRRSSPLTLARRVRLALIVWLAMLGLDLLVNGALFARMYQVSGSFLLPPAEAFRRIPLGYLSFLIAALSVVELASRIGVSRIGEGMRLGLLIGGVFGATWSLGLYSVATLSPGVALALAATWLALLTLASAVAAVGLGGTSLRGLALRAAAFDVSCIATVVALQSFGVVPTVTQ